MKKRDQTLKFELSNCKICAQPGRGLMQVTRHDTQKNFKNQLRAQNRNQRQHSSVGNNESINHRNTSDDKFIYLTAFHSYIFAYRGFMQITHNSPEQNLKYQIWETQRKSPTTFICLERGIHQT